MATMPDPLHVMVVTDKSDLSVMAATPEASKAVPRLSKPAEPDIESPMHSEMTSKVTPELPACPDMTAEVIYELTVTAIRFNLSVLVLPELFCQGGYQPH